MNLRSFGKLLFRNIGYRQTIFKNTFWLFFAEGISRFIELVLVVYIIRVLGPEEYGILSFAIAFVSIFVAFSDFGLSDITTREISEDAEVEKDYSAIFSLKIALSSITLALIFISSLFIVSDSSIRFIILILGLFSLINDFFYILYAFLRAHQKMEYEAGVKIIRSIVLVPFIAFVIFKFPSVESISYGYLFANVSSLTIILFIFYYKIKPIKIKIDKLVWKKFFSLSWPLGLAALFGAVFVSIDSVIMGYFGQIAQIGYYNASRKIIGVFSMPVTLIYVGFFPLLSKIFNGSKESFQKVWNYYMSFMIIIAIPIVVGGIIFASRIISIICGPGFNSSIPIFKILISIAGINFIYSSYVLILIISGHQKKYLFINFIAAVINVILNFVLIPIYSFYGASFSELITYVVLLALGIGFSKRLICFPPFNLKLFLILTMATFSSIVMAIFISNHYIYNLNIVYSIFIGMLIYFLVFFVFYRIFLKRNILF